MSKIFFQDSLTFEDTETNEVALTVGTDGANVVLVDGRQLRIQPDEPPNPADGDIWIKG